MDEELCSKLDIIAKDRFITRSGLINIAVRDYIAKEEAKSMLADIRLAMEKVQDDGKMDEETKQLFDDFETASKMAMKYSM